MGKSRLPQLPKSMIREKERFSGNSHRQNRSDQTVRKDYSKRWIAQVVWIHREEE